MEDEITMKFKYDFLKKIVSQIFMKTGLTQEDANRASEVLLKSNFTGVDSHGLSRLENYVYKLSTGKINVHPNLRQINDDEKLIKLDGDNGLGLVVAPRALDICIDAAKKHGIACVTVNNSNHFGVGNYYGGKIAENDLIGVVITNAAPSMAPFGGIEKLLGTNPIVISIPTGKSAPIILDMATSAVAYGAIEQFALMNRELEPNWAMDLEGNMTLDPKVVTSGNGMLMPMARHKGYGLALVVDILCLALAGAKAGKDIVSIRGRGDDIEHEGVGHVMLAIDISRFGSKEEFKEKVDSYVEFIKNSEKKAGVEEIFTPGEIEYNRLNTNMEDGIDLKENVYSYLEKIAREYNILTEGQSLKDFAQ